MARLPDFTALGQTPAPQAPLSVARVDVAPLEFTVRQGPGEAMIRGGREVASAGIQMQDRIDTLYAEDRTNKLQQVRTELEQDPEKGFLQVKGQNALTPDFIEGYGKKFDQAVTSISGSLPNSNAKQMFVNRAQVLRHQYDSSLMSHVAKEYNSFADNTEKEGVDSGIQRAASATDQADFDTEIMGIRRVLASRQDRTGEPQDITLRKAVDTAWEKRLDMLRIDDPELGLKVFQDNQESITDPATRLKIGHSMYLAAAPVLANDLANDPELIGTLKNAKKDLGPNTHTGHEMVDNLPDDWKMHVLALARTQLSQNLAQERDAMNDKLRDIHAMAISGVPVPAGFYPSKDELTFLYGQEHGARLYRDSVVGMQDLASSVQAVRGLDRADQLAIVRAVLPPSEGGYATEQEKQTTLKNVLKTKDRNQTAILETVAPPAGSGFAGARDRQRVLLDAVKTIWNQQDTDPAGYVVQSVPSVSEKLIAALRSVDDGDANATRRAFEDYATSVVAEQQRIGMPKHAILPGTLAQSVVNQFYSSKDGGQNAAQTIAQLSEQWGKAWPMVYGQIQKDIPGSAIVIGSGMDPTSAAAQNLVTAGNMKERDLKDGVPHDVSTGISKTLPEEMADFRLAMSQTVGGNALFNTFYDQTEKLALMYARQGKKDKDAVKQAYQDTIGNRYNFVTNANTKSPYMVPKGEDEGDIASGANYVISNVDKLDLALPKSRSGLNAKQTEEAYTSVLKASAYWVNAPRDAGLVLYANGAAVLDKQGQPIIRSWYFFKKSGPDYSSPDAGFAEGAM